MAGDAVGSWLEWTGSSSYKGLRFIMLCVEAPRCVELIPISKWWATTQLLIILTSRMFRLRGVCQLLTRWLWTIDKDLQVEMSCSRVLLTVVLLVIISILVPLITLSRQCESVLCNGLPYHPHLTPHLTPTSPPPHTFVPCVCPLYRVLPILCHLWKAWSDPLVLDVSGVWRAWWQEWTTDVL